MCLQKCEGWHLMSSEQGLTIQRCDECEKFKDDDEAVKFVVEDYYRLRDAIDTHNKLVDIAMLGY